MGLLTRIRHGLFGSSDTVPGPILEKWPELHAIRLRRGGLPVRVGGWCLGRSTVAGITLGRTVWLAPGIHSDPGLLLHELRHAQQFEADRLFPIRYVWASLTRGYTRNPYELDAVAYAGDKLNDGATYADASPGTSPDQDGLSWSGTLPRRS
ncbi:MAG TPA: hypothetical protein VKZ41_11805 [Gemmatimonadales bacterium]|nr:hypothetical protein [Gemmatimonadales bacterium]